ncbi:MAG: efflux RND transporter permease subunit [Planctomycetes bacterium]|nr:efflux RND transporter permease subunit [Planctomycetota bacterium]
MRKLLEAAATHPVLANLLMTLTLVGGGICYMQMPVEVMPEFSANRILVTVAYPGASSSEVEEGICQKIEDAVEGIEGIRNVESTSRESLASVNIELEEWIKDVQRVQNDIRDRVDAIDTFPEDAEEPVVTEILLKNPVMLLTIYGDAPERTLRELAYEVRDDLVATDDVSQITLKGVREYEISIEVSEAALRTYGLTLQEVSDAVRRGSLNLPGGTLRTRNEDFKIEITGRRYTGLAYRDLVVVARADGTVVRLHQIAEIRDGFSEDEVRGRYNGKRAVMIQIDHTAQEDALKISKAVHAVLDRHRATAPQGIQMEIYCDFSEMIIDRANLLISNGQQGLILVFLTLWLFLNLRLSFWVAMGIPVAFAFAGFVMFAMGQSINMINLFGMIMVLGMVVDDAIVIGEHIHTYRQSGMPPLEAAKRGVAEMALPVFGAVSTTIAAFLPLMFVSGIMGKFFAVLPVVVIAVLTGSLLESYFCLPAHLSHSKRPGAHRMRARVEAFLEFVIHGLYAPINRLALKHRYVTIACSIAVLLLAAGMVAGGLVPFLFFPRFDNQYVQAFITFPEGTPAAVTEANLRRIEDAAESLNAKFAASSKDGPLVQKIYADLGSGGKTNAGMVFIVLAGPEKRELHSEQVLRAWREAAGAFPDAVSLTYGDMRGPGVGGHDIEVHLRGSDLQDLRRASVELQEKLATYNGAYEVQDDFQPGKRELRVALKPQGRALGITLGDLATQLRQGFYGAEAMRVQRGRDEVKVQVRYPKEERAQMEDLYRIRVRTPTGMEVPFVEVGDVKLVRSMAEIRRRNGKRRVAVTAMVDPKLGNSGDIRKDLDAGYLDELRARYPQMAISFEGAEQERADSITSLKRNFVFALLGIFFILAVIFRSYLQPILIMLVIPFGLIGAVAGHLVLGEPLTMMSLFGLVALTGVVVNDSLVFIDYINGRQREGAGVMEAVYAAGPARFRAIMLTSLTTVAGIAPIMLERSFQAQFLIPMAISLAGGLIFSTFVTLFIIPCLYVALNDVRRALSWLRHGTWPTRELVEPAHREFAGLVHAQGD